MWSLIVLILSRTDRDPMVRKAFVSPHLQGPPGHQVSVLAPHYALFMPLFSAWTPTV